MDNNRDSLRVGATQTRVPVTVTCARCGHTDRVEPGGPGWEACTQCGEAWNADNLTWVRDLRERGPHDPVHRYLWAIHSLLRDGSVYLQHRANRKRADLEYPVATDRVSEAPLIGWYGNDWEDEEPYAACRYWYLIPHETFQAVTCFYRGSTEILGATHQTIRKQLRELKLLYPSNGRAYDFQIAPDLPRVLRIIKPF